MFDNLKIARINKTSSQLLKQWSIMMNCFTKHAPAPIPPQFWVIQII